MDSTDIPLVVENPIENENPIDAELQVITTAEIADLHTAITDLHMEQQNTNGLLIFLIGLICGIVFFKYFLQGWLSK